MRHCLFRYTGLPILLICLGATAAPAQAPDDAEAIRRQIKELKESLKKIEKDYDEAMAKRRAELDLKLKKLEQEHLEALRKEPAGVVQKFNKEHAEFTQKIQALQQREQSILRKAEAKEKGFYVNVEMKGRLEKRISNWSHFEGIEPITWWEVIAGDVRYELDFKKNAALLKLVESNQHQIVLVTGVVVRNNWLEVQALKVIKD